MSTTDDVIEESIRLARSWLAATAGSQTARERRTTGRLAALVADPAGLELAVRFVDRVARPQDVRVAARELAALTSGSAAGFLGPLDRAMLGVGALVAPALPGVVVPAARQRLRSLVGHLVADDGPGLAAHLAGTRADGFSLNLNLLGEAVLGEREAAARLARVTALVERPDVDYVSVKVSAVASQLSTWDTDGSVERVVDRLRPLYATAARHRTFLNLDMEEYRDLALTVRVFERLVSDPELLHAEAGIVLQAYLPDAADALDELTDIATARRAAGGARLKVRLVKGANLAMEQVEAELHGWSQAPYGSKAEVDAAYLRLVDRALDPARTAAMRVGVASHNLFHVAAAHLLAQRRGVTEALDVEMLQGMAPAQARAVRDEVGTVLLYTPVVARHDFDVAISYLVRRLEENSASQNFLHALFAQDAAMDAQAEAFRVAFRDRDVPSTAPRRAGREEAAVGERFANTPDTDPAVAAARAWARTLVGRDVPVPVGAVTVSTTGEVDAVISRAVRAQPAWAATPPGERARALRAAAAALEEARGDLVATMVRETGKTVAEADPEVSEAVDFARYYADRAADLADGVVPGAVHRPAGLAWSRRRGTSPSRSRSARSWRHWPRGALSSSSRRPRLRGAGRSRWRRSSAGCDRAGTPAHVLSSCSPTRPTSADGSSRTPTVARVVLTGSIETAALFAGVACRPRACSPRPPARTRWSSPRPPTWTSRSPTSCAPRSGTPGRSARRRRWRSSSAPRAAPTGCAASSPTPSAPCASVPRPTWAPRSVR